MSKVDLKIRHSIVYSKASFPVDKETGKLLTKQLAQLGIGSDLFSSKPIPIQEGRKELSKEELRQRYIYPSSIKRLTELEESILIDEDVREFESAATKPNLSFLTPSQKERLENLLKGRRLFK